MIIREEKYQIGTQSGQLLWDITSILNDIESGVIKYKTILVDVNDLVETNNFNGNPEHAMSTDIKKAILVVELGNGKTKLIDGNHRLYKAKMNNVKEMRAYFLNKDLHSKYIIDYNKELYNKIVEEF